MAVFILLGIVMMIGIVVNNAILIVDQMNAHVREDVPRHKAMISAATETLSGPAPYRTGRDDSLNRRRSVCR